MLDCVVKVIQHATINGLRNEYEIIKVKKHIKRPEQLTLSNYMNIKNLFGTIKRNFVQNFLSP